MMDRLSAEEDMAASTAAAVGANTRGGQWIRSQWRKWERLARGTRQVAAKAASESDLKAVGIGVRVVEMRRDG